jgi:hypothetical protein
VIKIKFIAELVVGVMLFASLGSATIAIAHEHKDCYAMQKGLQPFTTPVIVSTSPSDEAINVSTNIQYSVLWSEPMERRYRYVIIEPQPIDGIWFWSLNNRWLNYTGATWSTGTTYTLTFNGIRCGHHTPAGGDLIKTFSTIWTPAAANGLWVERSNPHVILHWYNSTNPSNDWHIYYTTNRFATFPTGWFTSSTPATSRSWVHSNTLVDGNTWYYIVRGDNGGKESGNSTMGVKIHRAFTLNAAPQTNIMWLSLPYNSIYKKASDIVCDLEGGDGVISPSTKIDVVGKWVPGLQASTTYFYDLGFMEWNGDDFAINPGDGIYVNIISTFNWYINGTDSSQPLTFTFNPSPQTNVMWFTLPSTCTYRTAEDIVIALEGGDGWDSPHTKMDVVGCWIPSFQAATGYFCDFDFDDYYWMGDDFTINPGDSIYFNVVSSFTWTPALITPEVP